MYKFLDPFILWTIKKEHKRILLIVWSRIENIYFTLHKWLSQFSLLEIGDVPTIINIINMDAHS